MGCSQACAATAGVEIHPEHGRCQVAEHVFLGGGANFNLEVRLSGAKIGGTRSQRIDV